MGNYCLMGMEFHTQFQTHSYPSSHWEDNGCTGEGMVVMVAQQCECT